MYINIKMSGTSRSIIKMWAPKTAFLFFILSSYTTGCNPNNNIILRAAAATYCAYAIHYFISNSGST